MDHPRKLVRRIPLLRLPKQVLIEHLPVISGLVESAEPAQAFQSGGRVWTAVARLPGKESLTPLMTGAFKTQALRLSSRQ